MKQSKQARHLGRFALRTLIHKYYTNAANELTSFLAASALAATFFYIFYDFLHKQLSDALPTVQNLLAMPVIVLLAGLALFWSLRSIKMLKQPRSCYDFAKFLGANKSTLDTYNILAVVTLVLCIHTALYWFTRQYLVPESQAGSAIPGVAFLISALTAFTISFIQKPSTTETHRSEDHLVQDSVFSPSRRKVWSLIRWRITFMSGGLVKACWLGVLLSYFALIATIFTVQNLYLAGMGTYLMGTFACLSLAFLLQRDLETSWIDKQIGTTHHDFVTCYLGLAGLASFVLIVAIVFAMAFLIIAPTPYNQQATDLLRYLDTVPLCFAAITPCLLTPALMLQIDGRKPLSTALTVVLPSMFIATGILMHPAVFILVPVGMIVGLKYQVNRFYRA